MDEKLLCQIGLTTNQAHVYRLLVERKSLRPSQLVKMTHESRANCYALLDKLVDMGLARRIDVDKKLTYFPESPVVLEKLLNEQIAEAQAKLQAAQRALPRMMSVFNDQPYKTRINVRTGKEELQTMYVEQMEQPDRHLYFIRSIADVPFMSLETMRQMRALARNYKKRRYGVTPVTLYHKVDASNDARTNLKRAWLPATAYTAPVEWAVSGDIVHAMVFHGEGEGISIKNPQVAESLRQILQLLFEYIKKDPDYKPLYHDTSKISGRSNAT